MNTNTEPKADGLIIPSITLRKLQQNSLIPAQEKSINLQSNFFIYHEGKTNTKYLLLSKSNKFYYGELNKDKQPQSKEGICIFSDGSYYQGSFSEGKIKGKGKLTNVENSFSYQGQWRDGQPHGKGIQIIGTNKFQGDFEMGKKHGKGKLLYGDGSKYQGQFKMGNIEGEGRYFNKNHFWDGQWKDGYLQGKGKQIIAKKSMEDLSQSSEYVGDFVKGERSGYGNFVWNGKYEYEGQFKNGQLDGKGIFKFKGKVYAGTWAQGTELKISQVKITQANKP